MKWADERTAREVLVKSAGALILVFKVVPPVPNSRHCPYPPSFLPRRPLLPSLGTYTNDVSQ